MALPRTALLMSAVDPNDPAVVDTWTDVAQTRMLRVKNAGRGRQYEIGQAIAGRMDADLLNIDEYLNPANSSSPLLSTSKLMRRVRWMAVLPAAGTGNLVNQGNIKADPSFESYVVGSTTSWIYWWGVQPTVVSTPVHSGTRAAQQAITGGAGIQGMVVELRLIPGDVYTASVWVNQSAANTAELSINGKLPTPMASTAATGWVKLVGTFTADQPTVQVCVVYRSPTLSGTLAIDEIQVEQGAAATAFVTTGPRIRGLWGGHVEKLPITWEAGSNGYTGTAHLSAVGPLAAIAQIGVKTDYAAAVAGKQPNHWWPLWDGRSTTVFDNGIDGKPPMVPLASKYGPIPFTPGMSTDALGDPGGTGVLFKEDMTTPLNSRSEQGTSLVNYPLGSLEPNPPVAPAPWSATVAFWAKTTVVGPPGSSTQPHDYSTPVTYRGDAGGIHFYFLQYYTGEMVLRLQGINGNSEIITPNTVMFDGGWHHLVGTVTQDAANTSLALYIDGTLRASSTVGTAVAVTLAPKSFRNLQIGGNIYPDGTTSMWTYGGILAHIVLWYRALTQQDVTDLWNAGRGYPGDTPGQRLNRLFGLYYVGPTVVDTGRTLLGPSGALDGTKLGQVAQRIVDSEAGNLFENRDAALEFDGRDVRFLSTISQATFGENIAGGEIPYRDTPVFGYDTAQLSNQATVTQTGGTKTSSSDSASIKSYYPRSITINTDAQSGAVAIDHANWLVATRSQPKQRVERITLDPGANPSIQAAVMDLELNQRYTLKRVAKSGNSGAGVTMTGDFFLENINHRDYDPEKGTWLVDLILSPAPLQPWILGDPTYGQLGVTTVLGF